MSETEPESPCISVCILDQKNICMGCYRSEDEIVDWFMADASRKREILVRSRERMAANTAIRLE